jgi:hypothetical protein
VLDFELLLAVVTLIKIDIMRGAMMISAAVDLIGSILLILLHVAWAESATVQIRSKSTSRLEVSTLYPALFIASTFYYFPTFCVLGLLCHYS